jgi:hypothetical protein
VVLGFLAGALVVDYLSTRAGPQFIQVMRRSYQYDEEQLAACARRRGDLREAARHYANAADASSLGGIALWDKARRMWTAGLPVTSLFLDWIASAQGGIEGPERVRHIEESRNRAMLAYSLNQLGSGRQRRMSMRRPHVFSHGTTRAHVSSPWAGRPVRTSCWTSSVDQQGIVAFQRRPRGLICRERLSPRRQRAPIVRSSGMPFTSTSTARRRSSVEAHVPMHHGRHLHVPGGIEDGTASLWEEAHKASSKAA